MHIRNHLVINKLQVRFNVNELHVLLLKVHKLHGNYATQFSQLSLSVSSGPTSGPFIMQTMKMLF